MMFDYKDYGSYKAITTSGARNWTRRLALRMGLRNRYLHFLDAASRRQPLIEIGCGDGSFLELLRQSGFERLLGLEPSPSYQQKSPPGSVLRCFANEYFEQVPSASVGTVLALDVFEHIPVPELRTLLALIEDRLLPGGRLIFRIPNLASGLGLYNYHGDVSHTTALNEVSLRQLVFSTHFVNIQLYGEPLAYPRNAMALLGLILWLPYRFFATAILAAFGIRARILTPNIICVLIKAGSMPL